jgi:two-component system response regulator AtoC
MTKRNTFVFSNDAQLEDGLQEALGGKEEWQLVNTSIEILTSGDCLSPQPEPSVAILDLRNGHADAMLERLPDVQRSWRASYGRHIPFVGIIDQGLAAGVSAQADRCLAGMVSWPDSASRLRNMLLDVSHSTAPATVADECRVIHGTKSKFITYTPELFSILDQLETVAKRNFTVLLIGETGTGKTTLGRIIHELSSRHNKRFVNVACGSLPGELVDSELFGHVRGAFTGADRDKEGKFDVANGGTLLLDEIDVLGMMQQAKLLRVLETGEFEPVGSNDTHHADTRTIVASNVCLYEKMDKQEFRADLFYRLDQVRFEIPPLRRRPNDIVPIAIHAIEECCQEIDVVPPRICPDFLDALKGYDWPGNIRELRNEVRRAVMFCQDGILTSNQLSQNILKQRRSEPSRIGDTFQATSELASEVAQTERDAIEQMLSAHEFNRAATARALGISRVTLYNKMRKYGIRAGQRGPS